ncbi:MAG: hypothetical protein AUK35_06880 [Zetaproteobacteria bacterium CG2_30_46_52]|nr:MAG: hypothetical protein AUK35_06880 [Zetaproteobacteria bacterium CG2_30_46_52]
MYNAYFGFSEKPFTIAPNPRYLLMSERHQEALAHMLYGLQGEGGVMVLTGEVGTGKTTICRRLLERVPDKTNIAYIINPKLTSLELLASICDEMHISYPAQHSIKDLTDLLNDYLLAQHAAGRHTVVIIDEAQNLDPSVLEQLRLLTNLETNDKKLLQIMLLGQPELAELLQRQELRQLAQRITARYHLTPLSKSESHAYINHRLSVAGLDKQSIFSPTIINLLYKHTHGVPRLMNLIADRALLGTYSCEQKTVSKKILKQAVLEVCGHHSKPQGASMLWVYATSLLLISAGLIWMNLQTSTSKVTNVHTTITEPLPVTITQQPEPALRQDIEADPMAAIIAETLPEEVAVEAVVAEEVVAEEVVSQKAQPEMLSLPNIPSTPEQDIAFESIFAAWGITYDAARDGAACAFASTHQLRCLRQRGDIAQMRSLNRPAVLTLSDAQGQTTFASITALSGTTAKILAAGDTAQVSLAQLVLQSHNDFTILWRAPMGYQGPVRPGHEGKLVQLLAEKISAAEHLQWIGAPRLTYDAGLKDQVKSFQRGQGLNPDGVAGPITWIHINSLVDNGFPSLQTTPASEAKL